MSKKLGVLYDTLYISHHGGNANVKKSFPVVSSWHHRSMKRDFVVTCLFTIALTVAGHGAPVRNWQTEKVVTLTVVCGQRYCSSLFAVS